MSDKELKKRMKKLDKAVIKEAEEKGTIMGFPLMVETEKGDIDYLDYKKSLKPNNKL